MKAEAVGDERHSNQQKEAQHQNLDGGMPVDELATGVATASITIIVITTAVTITQSSFAIPIAVMMLSSEKTISSSTIRVMILGRPVGTEPGPPLGSCPSI